MIDLQFDRVSKRYLIKDGNDDDGRNNGPRSLVRNLQQLRRPPQEFWAVRDVSFEVKRGEALGIIGHNGAGKSTILKLLSSITAPTSGTITINGRLSALIEVGSGFHPELTGRENIYLSGSILGMRRREITDKLDSIVEFAGIRQFIDTPVKRYSSGMYVRLGFSIAAHLDPDILLLDEVLAVGDAAFQAKCIQRIKELKNNGVTIVFISHDLAAVESLCDRVLLMRNGQVVASGNPREVIAEYRAGVTNVNSASLPKVSNAHLEKKAENLSLTFHHSEGEHENDFRTGEPITIRFKYIAHEHIDDAVFEVFFFSQDGDIKCHLTTEISGERIDLEPGLGTLDFTCAELALMPGDYYVGTTIIYRGAPLGVAFDWQQRCAMLRVLPGRLVRGVLYMPHQWHLSVEDVTRKNKNYETDDLMAEQLKSSLQAY